MNGCRSFICIMMGMAMAVSVAVAADDASPPETGKKAQADEYYIAIVDGVRRVERVDAGNLMPWHFVEMGYEFDRACVAGCPEHGPKCWQKCAREGASDGDLIVSLSCGLLRQEFASAQLARVGAGGERLKIRGVSPLVTYVSSGHYCAFKDRVHTKGDGLLLRRWEHGYVEVDDFRMLTDRRGNFFISPMGWPERALENIRHLFVPLDSEAEDCWGSGHLSLAEVENLKKSGFTRSQPGEFYDLCITHGLPLASVPEAYGIHPQPRPGKGGQSGEDAAQSKESEWGPVSLKPGSRFRDCRACPEMVVVPAGEFVMGSPPDEDKRDGNEGPQHRVRIKKPFAVGRFEVTYEEWDACVEDGGCGGYRPESDAWRGRQPVIYIKWEEAGSYTDWLSRKTGKTYRLLSEAEWEYSARAGTVTPFYTGDAISTDLANYDGLSDPYGKGREGLYFGTALPVGQYPPNRFGLHDMHGNVWEWTADCWNDSYDGAPVDGSPWLSGDCSNHVLRSAPSSAEAEHQRSAVRVKAFSQERQNMYEFGFRVARELEAR